ncbi:PREDICTED: protein FAR-RED IMPAIRED RESPONSE 1-like [Nicotiana attenuata]|uniref:protein FAR-RED IMPAIRED RESPONSE 1-like n=1 Tax=Nicotiana attenuata TaxID=49451 RepID=UPI0009051C64|nr:PREDICTED: protein FAR-RED IMPAIRED RESPONSE 1-like [Nicotiana attenuata]
MNEDESIDIDSDGNFNDGENHVDDGVAAAADDDDDDDDGHYLEEEEEVGEDREMPNDFNEENLVIGPITGMRSRKPRNKLVTKRRNCHARINGILEENGPWRVSKVVKKRNHQLDPALSRLMTGHRSLSKSLKRTLAAKDIVGLRPSKNIRVAEVLAGGPENLGCTPKDCRNCILKSRKLQLQEGDAQSLLKFFSDMQQKDREFYYSVDVDSFGRLCNVIWVHSHSKVAYEEFHDVICLDTTYLVN